jgi:protein-disulfide isomerase
MEPDKKDESPAVVNPTKNNFSIPAAIILAGLLIAFGVYLSRTPAPTANKPVTTAPSATTINLKPVTAADHILGNPNAPVVIVEFSDTECPYCKMFLPTMQAIMSSYGKNGQVAWVYRSFPIHSLSEHEAEATECAAQLGGNAEFWKYTDEIFATTTSTDTLDPSVLSIVAGEDGLNVTQFNACLSSGKYAATIQASYQDAIAAGAQGTPYSVMVLKTPLSTAQETAVSNYIAANNLASNVWISSDNTKIALDGALPLANVTAILDIVLNNK